MKTNLFILFAAGLLVALTAGCRLHNKHIVGNNNYVTKKVEVGQFNAIKLSSSADITYHQSSRNYIEIYGSDNIIPYLETAVEGRTLVVKYKKDVSVWKGKLEMKVFSPELNKLTINGSGNVHLANGLQTSDDISLTINGSGNIQGKKISCRNFSAAINGCGEMELQQIKSKECIVKIAGVGNIGLSGQTSNAQFNIAGSGNIGADKLKSQSISARISGSGNIRCHANNSLSARVTGSGDIAYRGNPQEIDAPRKYVRKLQ
ncbi:head GIN domain-containing protein [uncultured Bacteroides sp.]|uniref:head GIN domain-containing protein n=1 Tax=uncultured Bacteroides sp. TaxID=162156 RepID=UPI0025D8143A|nr:head GIN domain-containing protein [uncultured Bacteroides sp.]